MADNADDVELHTFVKNLTENRAENIIQRCQEENVHTVAVLKQVDNDGLQRLGFKLGDVAQIRSSLIKPDLSLSRKERIKDIIENISHKRKAVSPHSGKPRLSHGRHRVHKLYIGWQHCDSPENVSFKMRRLNQGGGIRAVEYDVNEAQTVNKLIDFGKKLFFPNGESSVGPVEEMDTFLGNYAGEIIKEFCDLDGKQCTFQEYLQCHGLYASKHNVYLLTKKSSETISQLIPESDTVDAGLTTQTSNLLQTPNANKTTTDHTNNRLNIKYLHETESSYSEVVTRLLCYSLKSCKENDFSIEAHEDHYNPLSNGFTVIAIEKDDRLYLDGRFQEDGSTTYKFPQSTKSEEDIILHCIDEIFGYEADSDTLLLGIVVSCHGRCFDYVWFRDGVEYLKGPNLCLIEANIAGAFTAGIIYGGVVYIHDTSITVAASDCGSYCVTNTDRTSHCIDASVSSESIIKPICSSTKRDSLASGISVISSDKQDDKSINVTIPLIEKSAIVFDNLYVIGQGAFGQVYRGEWIGTPVAIKEIKVKRIKLLQNILHGEIQLHGRIRHPNIVQLMAYAVERSTVYILSEFIDGPNLDEVLFGCCEDQNGENINLTCSQKINISIDILQGLTYLHNVEPSVIHQDIKPENIIIHRHTFIAKLCDFGVSRLKAIETMLSTHSHTIAQPRTPLYQAPEVLLNTQKSSKESDVWSMCCTLIELFTGKSVWSLEMSADIAHVIEHMNREEKPNAYSVLCNNDLPLTMCQSIGSGLSYNPKMRPTDIFKALS